MRVHLPVRPIVPGHVVGALRMADEQVFHLAAAVDEQRIGGAVEQGAGVGGAQVLHAVRAGLGGLGRVWEDGNKCGGDYVSQCRPPRPALTTRARRGIAGFPMSFLPAMP
ncbi:hypothetical protein D3C81_2080150 [compost metagenome]